MTLIRLVIFCLVTAMFFPFPAWAGQGEGPVRIVSLGPINTKNIFLLGAGDRLVADTNYCVRPAEARTKEKIGSVLRFNLEKIIGLRPDLVLATNLSPARQLSQLKKAGIPVVRFPQPASFQDICAQFLELGRLLGLSSRAEAIVGQARKRVAVVQRETRLLKAPKVLLQVGANPLFVSVEDSFTNDYIRLAGGINIAAGEKSGRYNREKVVGHDPDLILIAIMGSQSGIGSLEREKWLGMIPLTAARKRKVFVLDPNLLCSPSPITFAESLEQVALLLHPSLASKFTKKESLQ